MARLRGMQRVFLAAAAACVMAGGGAAGWGDWKNKAASIPSKCFLPPDSGLCRGFFPSYFYNPAIGNCDCFVYGGCTGNDNNFVSREECARECGVQHPVNTPKCRELFDEQDFAPQPSPPVQPPTRPPYHPPHTPPLHPPHPPQATQHPPQATQHPPLATQHPPLATQHPPLATQHPPLATQHPPLATQHPPQATQHPPQAIHPWQATAVLSGHTPQTVQPVYSFPRNY